MTRLLVVAVLASVVFAGEPGDPTRDLGDRDPEVRISALRRLARIEGEDASRSLTSALADQASEVREAAVTALGGRRDAIALKALRGALKRFEKDPYLLAAVIASLGACEDQESAGPIGDIARKSVGKNPALFRAAVDALGKLPSRKALEALMDLHGSAASASRTSHGEYLSEIEDSLREATGLPFLRRETWAGWWRHAKKDWRPPVDPDPEAAVYRSDGWRFTIEKPEGARWTFSRPIGTAIRILFSGGEEARFAWVEVLAHAVTERSPETVREAADAFRKRMERELRDIRNASYSAPGRLGKSAALTHSVTGIFEGGHVAGWRAWFLERHGVIYVASTGWESGATDKVKAEIDAILASFRFLKG